MYTELTLPSTGITGYLGGDVLSILTQDHPDWEISALVRSEEKAKQLSSVYPNVRTVLGDVESTELIADEVKKAGIVYSMFPPMPRPHVNANVDNADFIDCNSLTAVQAIAQGASSHTPSHPLYLIHTGGTGVLTLSDQHAPKVGTANNKQWDEWTHLSEVTTLPDEAPHRLVDKAVLDLGQQDPTSVKTAIVCPPVIYGAARGRGPCNTRSMQAYWASELVLRRKKGFVVGEGENTVSAVHVQDVADLFVLLGQAAAAAGGGDASWGTEGYYFAESQAFRWKDMHAVIARAAFNMGLIPSPETEFLITEEQIRGVLEDGAYVWGTNQWVDAVRARRLLGWKPYRPSLREVMPEIVAAEARRLG